MTERAQDKLIDRIIERAHVELFKNGKKYVELLPIANRYKVFREATEEEQAEILRIAEAVHKSIWIYGD